MPVNQQQLQQLWRAIASNQAEEQERIQAAWLSGESGETKYVDGLLKLLDDDAGQVRWYALQALVLDLQQIDKSVEDLCWRLLREDSDEDVRSMAAACLGKIFFNSRSPEAFAALKLELLDQNQSTHAKGAIYTALFEILGKPPLEWPTIRLGPKVFEESDIDWRMVMRLESQLKSWGR